MQIKMTFTGAKEGEGYRVCDVTKRRLKTAPLHLPVVALYPALLSAASVTCGQPQAENIK